eukprot:1147695-Pelagomonas_calceolata.AAC.1
MFPQGQSAPFCPKYCMYMLHAAPACNNLQGLASMQIFARIPCTQRKDVQKRTKGAHNMKTYSAAESAAETHWPVSSNAAATPAHWEGALGSFLFLAVDALPAPSYLMLQTNLRNKYFLLSRTFPHAQK